MRLAHLHLPHRIPYSHSLQLQSLFQQRIFEYKAHSREVGIADPYKTFDSSKATSSSASRYGAIPHFISAQPPDPVILTFSTNPTYTVGRRHLTDNPLSSSQISFLTGKTLSPLASSNQLNRSKSKNEQNPESDSDPNLELAEFFPSPRGGLLTFHGPGQLTAYPIIDLRRHNITPRCYIRLLENVVRKTCSHFGVPNTTTTTDPGVWITDEAGKTSNRKICAVGVQVSRGVTGHGVGFNVLDQEIEKEQEGRYHFTDEMGKDLYRKESLPNEEDPGYLSWGFGRIVACGLEGKSVTWLTQEMATNNKTSTVSTSPTTKDQVPITTKNVSDIFVREFLGEVNRLGKTTVEGIYQLSHEDYIIEDKNLV